MHAHTSEKMGDFSYIRNVLCFLPEVPLLKFAVHAVCVFNMNSQTPKLCSLHSLTR